MSYKLFNYMHLEFDDLNLKSKIFSKIHFTKTLLKFEFFFKIKKENF